MRLYKKARTMKSYLSFCIFILLICYSTQIPKYENCDGHEILKQSIQDCIQVTCLPSGQGVQMLACAQFTCAIGAQIGYHKGNDSLPYPDCCDYPICRE